MTSEEAIEILIRYKEESEEDYYVKRAEALKMAIKALKQEYVLDKIRAEIDEVYEELDGCDPDSLGTFVCRIDDILDKYKADKEQE